MKDISELMLDRLLLQAGKIQAQELLIQKLQGQKEANKETSDLYMTLNEWSHKTEWAQDVYNEVTCAPNMHPADVIKKYVDELKHVVNAQAKALDLVEKNDAFELNKWQWARDLRSSLYDQMDGSHLADWLKYHFGSLTDENAELQQQLAVAQEREATREHPSIDEDAVNRLAAEFEENADEIGLVPTGKINAKGRMLYKILDINGSQALQHAQAAEAVAEAESLPEIPDGFIQHDGNCIPVGHCQEVVTFLRNGKITGSHTSDFFEWKHSGDIGDIIAYKVIEE